MIFNTPWFLLFALIVYPVFFLLPSNRVRFYFILAACAVFHGHFAGAAGVIPIIVMGLITYGFALLLGQAIPADPSPSEKTTRHYWAILALLVPVTGLIYYKYRFFIFSSLAFLPPTWLEKLKPFFTLGPMPLAISFFTFEFVHYLTDVIRGDRPIKNFFHFSLFSIFFPSIVSGPIKRYQNFVPQIASGMPRPSPQDLLWGLGQVVLGFSKKLIVADNATLAVQLLERQARWDFYSVSLLILLLSIRILFDFSGYSDIAIGLARMLGIRLPVNFNFPYLARNISDFWNRWHISLSSWIRDYLYIPLGGGRVPPWRKLVNLATVMALCGLWHGAAWHFLLWGVYQGLGLGVHAFYERNLKTETGVSGIRLNLPAIPAMMARGLTLAFVGYGWLLFFYPLPKVFSLTANWFMF
jgi:alginate O-acetyltransferase complex protein AlgI